LSGGTKNTLRIVAAHLCALGVAVYFLYAAYPKIAEPRQFVIDIRNYHMVPEQYLNLIAIFLPWLEIGAALALVLPVTRRAGAVLIGCQLMMFIAAISYAALYMGYDIKCGCTGKNSAQAGWWTIALDAGLAVATVAAVVLLPKKKAPAAGVDVLPGGDSHQPAKQYSARSPLARRAKVICEPSLRREKRHV
jgi:uncharacterized membrane protein YphA (DoxX/SURF4 family)